MANYTRNDPWGFDQGLLNKEILSTFFNQFLNQSNISPFMGSADSNILLFDKKK